MPYAISRRKPGHRGVKWMKRKRTYFGRDGTRGYKPALYFVSSTLTVFVSFVCDNGTGNDGCDCCGVGCVEWTKPTNRATTNRLTDVTSGFVILSMVVVAMPTLPTNPSIHHLQPQRQLPPTPCHSSFPTYQPHSPLGPGNGDQRTVTIGEASKQQGDGSLWLARNPSHRFFLFPRHHHAPCF